MKNLNKYIHFINESDNKWDPFKAITYKVEVRILFEGFDPSTLFLKLLFPHYEEINEEKIKTEVERKLEIFKNIISYEIIKYEEATGTDRILPMH